MVLNLEGGERSITFIHVQCVTEHLGDVDTDGSKRVGPVSLKDSLGQSWPVLGKVKEVLQRQESHAAEVGGRVLVLKANHLPHVRHPPIQLLVRKAPQPEFSQQLLMVIAEGIIWRQLHFIELDQTLDLLHLPVIVSV